MTGAPAPLRVVPDGDGWIVSVPSRFTVMAMAVVWVIAAITGAFGALVGLVLWFWPLVVFPAILGLLALLNLALSVRRSVRVPSVRLGREGLRCEESVIELPYERLARVEQRLAAVVVVAKSGSTFALLPVEGDAAAWLIDAISSRIAATR